MNPFSFGNNDNNSNNYSATGSTEGFSFTIPQNGKKKEPQETDATNSFGGFSFGRLTPVSTSTTFGESTPFGTSNEDDAEKENKTKKDGSESYWKSCFFSDDSDNDFDVDSDFENLENGGNNEKLNFYERIDNSTVLNFNDFDNSFWEDGTQQRISLLQSRIGKVKKNLDAHTQEFPQNSFESWKEAQTYLKEKFDKILSILDKELVNKKKIQSHITNLENDLIYTNSKIQNLLKRKKKIENDITTAKQLKMKFDKQFQSIEKKHDMLLQMCNEVSLFCENEHKMNTAIEKQFEQKSFENFDCSDISKLLWKMDLTKYQQIFEENQINGKLISMMNVDWATWELMGIKKRDCFYMTFYFEMFQIPGFYRTFSNEDLNDCVVCSHNTPEKTIHLLEEYEIFIEQELILKNNYCAPILIFSKSLKDLNIDLLSQRGKQIMLTLAKWRKLHELHLKTIRKYHKQCKINK